MQLKKTGRAALVATALLTLSPAAAMATTTTPRSTTTTTTERDTDIPWGLLGLLGLAGLLGRKRKEADIHVDNRRTP